MGGTSGAYGGSEDVGGRVAVAIFAGTTSRNGEGSARGSVVSRSGVSILGLVVRDAYHPVLLPRKPFPQGSPDAAAREHGGAP